jgi:hypothetical protein
MGAYVETPRYEVVSTRLSEQELREVQCFASDRKLSVCTAARLLLNIGLEALREK